MLLITSQQIRACRAILRWSIDDLSDRSGVSKSTLMRIEKENGFPHARIQNIEKIRIAFESTKAILIPDASTIIILDNKSANQ